MHCKTLMTGCYACRYGERTGNGRAMRNFRPKVRTEGSDRRYVPLAVALSAANVHDSMVFEEMLGAVEPIKRPVGKPGRPRKRPEKLPTDKGYDFPRCSRPPRPRCSA